jgi:outer membrane protein OmpA-like peptidoglycan-associated protein
VWRYPNFNRSAQQPVQIRAVNEFGPSATTSAFTFPRFMLNNGLFRVGGGGHDSTTFTRAASIGANSQIVQPFYFDNVKNKWVQMTYGTSPFDFALGFGTGNEPTTTATRYDPARNWTGATVYGTFQSPDPFLSPVTGSTSVTSENYSCTFEGSSPVCMGTGTLIASANFTLGGRTIKVVNRYTLAASSKFLEVTTSVQNPDGSVLDNVNVWVGTRDDFVGIDRNANSQTPSLTVNRYQADFPQKFRGTISIEGVFQTLTSSTTERASALVLESIDGAGLFFSTSDNVNVTVAPCCESLQALAAATTDATPSHTARGFENAVTLNPSASAISTPLGAEAFKPANPDADFFQTRRTDLRDSGYAIHLPLGSIASGQSKGATWFLGGTAYSERSSLLQTVSEAAEELSQAAGSVPSSGSGVSAPVVTPRAVVLPIATKKSTIRKATDNKPARLLGKSLNKDVLFVADSTRLSPEARKSLRQAARLAKASGGKIAVTGFAAMTNRGSAYERSVALKRARVVARFLRAKGFDDWIYFHGLSGRQSLAFKGDPRRVEIRILK